MSSKFSVSCLDQMHQTLPRCGRGGEIPVIAGAVCSPKGECSWKIQPPLRREGFWGLEEKGKQMVVATLAPDLLRALLETCIYSTLLPVQGSVFRLIRNSPDSHLDTCIWLCTCCSGCRFRLMGGRLGVCPGRRPALVLVRLLGSAAPHAAFSRL